MSDINDTPEPSEENEPEVIEARSYVACHCGRTFGQQEGLDEHMLAEHPGWEPPEEVEPEIKDNKPTVDVTAPVLEAEGEGPVCPQCGKVAQNKAGLAAHIRFKHGTAGGPVTPSGSPAIIPEWRRATNLRIGLREITMLDPRCTVCQSEDNAGTDWFTRCPHDPYVTIAAVPDSKPVYEDDPDNPGRRRVIGMDDGIRYVTIPNTRGVSLSKGSMAGMGVVNARRKGFILPSELRSASFPNGIAEACQFRDCKYQKGLKEYQIGEHRGSFCREVEAQLVWYMETGTTIDIGEWDDYARQNRARMLQAAQTR